MTPTIDMLTKDWREVRKALAVDPRFTDDMLDRVWLAFVLGARSANGIVLHSIVKSVLMSAELHELQKQMREVGEL